MRTIASTISALYEPAEKPLAIMVPAWHETGVIGRMAELAATTLDYENYHIFVGTYPNDPDTQRDVDEVCARFRNVHKVVCARPGPTSKADCLNNVLDAILQFEQRAGLEFAGFILHDAEDVISAMELRLFNYLVDRKDLIQLPVYPFERRWSDFTSAHYMDEFAELHGKDILVREALAGQVPSAGVGTCFSRRAVMALLADGDGIAFDVQSLTEDYDIGFRLRAKGMTEIFVRFPVVKDGEPRTGRPPSFGKSAREASVICVREYFPNTLPPPSGRSRAGSSASSIRGSRRTDGRSEPGAELLPLARPQGRHQQLRQLPGHADPAAADGAARSTKRWSPDSYRFLSIFEGDRWLTLLLAANLLLMTNRIVQRVFFVSSYYGLVEGLLSIPRLFWGNFINFMANWRAIRQIVRHGDPRRVAWDKTTHDFPVLGEAGARPAPARPASSSSRARSTEAQLEHALVHRSRGLKLGSWLVHEGVITAPQLAAAVAEQSGVPWETVDTLADRPQRRSSSCPAELALHYAVLPLREEGGTLVLASEGDLDPVSVAALARKLKRPVSYVIVPKGQVTVGLRHWHAPRPDRDRAAHAGRRAVAAGQLRPAKAEELWQEYVSRQVLFAEVLMSLGHLDAAALSAVLLRHERSSLSLGEYMVGQGMISAAVLQEALELQKTLQGSMHALLEREGAMPAPRRRETAGGSAV